MLLAVLAGVEGDNQPPDQVVVQLGGVYLFQQTAQALNMMMMLMMTMIMVMIIMIITMMMIMMMLIMI